MLSRTYNKERFDKLIRDARDPSFFERLFFRPYYIANINDARINKSTLKFCCPQCGKPVTRQKKWKFKNNWLRAELYCVNCNKKYRGMVSIRQTYDRIVTKKRILPIISENEGADGSLQQLSEKM
jgi:hypothetical protein